MSRSLMALALAGALLGGCNRNIDDTVNKSKGEVQAALAASTRALDLADQLPGADHQVEAVSTGVVWHFTLNGKRYASFTVSLDEKGPSETGISTKFEAVNDATEPGVPFLREAAKAVSEESVAAIIEDRPLDMAALQDRFKMQAVNPAAVVGAQQQIWGEAIKMGKEFQDSKYRAPTQPGELTDRAQPYEKKQPYDRTQPYDQQN